MTDYKKLILNDIVRPHTVIRLHCVPMLPRKPNAVPIVLHPALRVQLQSFRTSMRAFPWRKLEIMFIRWKEA